MRFCPICSNYLYLKEEAAVLHLLCRHCGYKRKMAPTSSSEALVLETAFQQATNQKQTMSQLNDYTRLDPTLPHLKTIACPNAACASQADPAKRDIQYIKTDAKNLKFQYGCTVCATQWSS